MGRMVRDLSNKEVHMEKDMTTGLPLKLIILFAVPLFVSNLFQQFYNIADTAIVGHILGDDALSAVGAVSAVYGFMLSISFGLTNGFGITVANYFGGKEIEKMRKAVAGTVVLSLVAAIIMTVIGCAGMPLFLELLHIPEEIKEDGYHYIMIIVSFFIVNFLYNMMASVLRALGNSMVPLVCLIIASILNIGLDVWFIAGLHLGIAGAAYATVIAQFLAGICCVIYIVKACPVLHLTKEDFCIDKALLKELAGSGVAMAMMFGVVNAGTVILQSGINGLGSDIIAARKVSEVYMMPASALGSTMATFASQNYGARKQKRVHDGVKTSVLIGFVWSTLVIAITYLFAEGIMKMLTGSDNRAIIEAGVFYLKVNLPFYYILIILCVLRSTMQAIGNKILPVISSTLELLGKLVTTLWCIAPLGYTAVCFCEPVTWIVCGGMLLVAYGKQYKGQIAE